MSGKQLGTKNNKNTNGSPKPNRKTNNEIKITKEYLGFFERFLAAWVAIATIVSAICFGYHDSFSGWMFVGAVVVTLIYGLHLYRRHVMKGEARLSISAALTTIIANALILGSIATSEIYRRIPTVERFHFSSSTAIISNLNRFSATPFRAVALGPKVPVARPIQLLLETTIANLQPSAAHILGYSLEISDSAQGPWTTLCPVSMLGRTLVWAHDPTEAKILKTDNFLDTRLLDKTLKPRDVISGWSAWECPNTCGFGFYRITLRDAAGNHSSGIVEQPTKNLREASIGGDLDVTGQSIDISRATTKFEPNCSP